MFHARYCDVWLKLVFFVKTNSNFRPAIKQKSFPSTEHSRRYPKLSHQLSCESLQRTLTLFVSLSTQECATRLCSPLSADVSHPSYNSFVLPSDHRFVSLQVGTRATVSSEFQVPPSSFLQLLNVHHNHLSCVLCSQFLSSCFFPWLVGAATLSKTSLPKFSLAALLR